jgi:hypothetical protein
MAFKSNLRRYVALHKALLIRILHMVECHFNLRLNYTLAQVLLLASPGLKFWENMLFPNPVKLLHANVKVTKELSSLRESEM